MTGRLLKAGHAVRNAPVVPLAAWVGKRTDRQPARPSADLASSVDSVEDPGHLREAMAAEIARLRSEAEQAASDADAREEAALRRGHREGRDAGLAAAQQDGEERLAALISGLERAAEAFTAKSVDTEQFALRIAMRVLETILGDRTHYPELVTAAVARELELIEAESVRAVRVSAEDFTDSAPFTELAVRFPDLDIRRDRELAAGHCRIELELGHIDASIPLQAQRAGEALDAIAREIGAGV